MQYHPCLSVIVLLLLLISLSNQQILSPSDDLAGKLSISGSGPLSYLLSTGSYNLTTKANVTVSLNLTAEPNVFIHCAPTTLIGLFISVGDSRIQNVSFINCATAIGANSATSIYLSNVTFTGSTTAVALSSVSEVFISKCTFSGNYAPYSLAGGLSLQTCENITIIDSDFSSNSGLNGGAIYSYTSLSLHVINTRGYNNSAATSGGFLSTTSGSITLENVNLTKNNASQGGGAVYANSVTSFTTRLSTFSSNYALQYGGAIVLETSYESFIDSSIFDSNQVSEGSGGGIFYFEGTPANISNCTFTSNDALNLGGAVYLGATSTLLSCEFDSNNAGNGGAIYMASDDESTAQLVDCQFSKNSATVGGGSYFTTSKLVCTNCQFFNQLAQSNGGAVFLDTSSALFLNSTLGNNNAKYGAGVYTKSSSLSFTNSSLYNNNAVDYGGGFYVSISSTLSLFNTTFNINGATLSGGGGYIQASTLNLSSSTFTQNTAAVGGGLYILSTNATIYGSVLSLNTGIQAGGAIASVNSSMLSLSTTFYKNSANIGGGIYSSTSFSNLSSSIFTFNTAATWGGAIFANGTSYVALYGAEIANNSATELGGGIALYATSSGQFTNVTCAMNIAIDGGCIGASAAAIYIGNSNITDNLAYSNGGAIQVTLGLLYLQNVIMSQNNAQNGGAIFGNSAYFSSKFSTFYSNTAAQNGGAMYLEDLQGPSLIANNTITGNNAQNGTGLFLIDFALTLVIRDTLLSTSLSPQSTYCCNGMPSSSPNHTSCNYPVCLPSHCKEASGCSCPFSYLSSPFYLSSISLPPSFPLPPSINVTCTCLLGFGAICSSDDSTCSPGYTEINGVCADDCKFPGTLGCDPHVACEQSGGSGGGGGIVCGSCPTGFTGDGKTCTALCGDKICDGAIGEDCVSCPLDCTVRPCNQCGDGFCGTNETCNNCFTDCGSCRPLTCSGGCSSHGTCVAGVCQCQGPWTGPDCSASLLPIQIITNNSQPTVSISSQNALFSIIIRSLIETNSAGNPVFEIDFDSAEQNFSYVESPNSNSSKNSIWEYSKQLYNLAIINITFIEFEDPNTPYTFGNETTNFPANTLKFSLRVANWPFRSLQNSLHVVMDTTTDDSSQQCVTSQQDPNGNTEWVKIIVRGVAVYVQFDSYSIIDGISRDIKFVQNSTSSSVYAILPHFWTDAEFDPRYTVLLDDGSNECGQDKSSKKTKTIIIAVTVSVVGAILIGALVIYLLDRRRKKKYRAQWNDIKMKKQGGTSVVQDEN